MTSLPLRDGRDVAGRLGDIEYRLRQLEDEASRRQAMALKDLETDRLRSRLKYELWFSAFKAVAVAQIVFTIGLLIYRSFRA